MVKCDQQRPHESGTCVPLVALLKETHLFQLGNIIGICPLILFQRASAAVLMNLMPVACGFPTSALFVDLYKTSLLIIFTGRRVLPHDTDRSTTIVAHNKCTSVSDQIILVSVTAFNNEPYASPCLPPSSICSLS